MLSSDSILSALCQQMRVLLSCTSLQQSGLYNAGVLAYYMKVVSKFNTARINLVQQGCDWHAHLP